MSKDEKIPWDEKYRIGIRAIDSQHKKLFMIVNKLYDLEDESAAKDEIRSILYDFRDYMQTHFDEEEEFMRSINYDKLEEHKKLHQNLIEILASIIKTPANLGIIKSKMRVISKRALITHVLKEDIKIKDFIENTNIVVNLDIL